MQPRGVSFFASVVAIVAVAVALLYQMAVMSPLDTTPTVSKAAIIRCLRQGNITCAQQTINSDNINTEPWTRYVLDSWFGFLQRAVMAPHAHTRANVRKHSNFKRLFRWLLQVPAWSHKQHHCPLYLAVQYHIMDAVHIMLATTNHHTQLDELLHCMLGTKDAAGDTLLHVAARTKSAGFARVYLRQPAGLLTPLMQYLGLHAAGEDHSVGGQRAVYYNELNQWIGNNVMVTLLRFVQHIDGKSSMTLLPDVRNRHNDTILHLALRDGLSVSNWGKDIVSSMLSSCVNQWNLKPGEPNRHTLVLEAIPVVQATELTPSLFNRDFYSMNRPVLIRGGYKGAASIHAFVQQYAGVSFQTAPVPYATLYGQHAITSMTLQQCHDLFMTRQTNNNNDDNNGGGGKDARQDQHFRSYIFGPPPPRVNLTAIAPVPFWFLPASERVYNAQLAFGPATTGAQPHFHGPVTNTLVEGEKKWFIWAPEHAFFVGDHIPPAELEKEPHVLTCTQRAGDIVYLPANYGHAVVNVQHSLAVVYEYNR